MSGTISWKALPLLLLVSIAAQNTALGSTDSTVLEPNLEPDSRHEQISEMVVGFVEKSHYRHAAVDDELSSQILDRYIESMDNNRMYFLATDIEAFGNYRHQLDDMIGS